MSLNKREFSTYIKQFNFRELFNDMGWNNDRTTQPIAVDNEIYTLQAVAEKSGFKVLLCHPLMDGRIPDYHTRKKIERKVTKLFQEHLIIFFDSNKSEQIWQVVVREAGKPTKTTETRYHISQDPELLYQRTSGIFFELNEEEHITIIDVTKRVAENFHQNNEKVTKRFYDGFKKEHTAFLQFIEGIERQLDKDWYASLMLNRLMFCYFIQKKGFLDNDKNYLRTKLESCREKKGKNKFYSFYRNFLLALFHQGLGSPDHGMELKEEIGRIPYLNGGLFDEHELEKAYKDIDIDDKAFERLFDFFDQYEWHLDTRHTASGKDINPDVIGYIFEKYINDRAQMGAYYTKEDITDYISKNCIIPYLFDETKRQYPKAFAADAELWQMVKHSGGAYIYDAVRKGVDLPLPDEIAVGVDTSQPNLPERRKTWNNPAPLEYALPTEIWREIMERRNRYVEVKSKIANGEILHINDFITYNLNIRQFAQDVISHTNDPDFLRHFYKALNDVTVIDPTCGSGAFLFAALNILEPLYAGCIQRMESFVDESTKGRFKFFEDILAQINSSDHPNPDYFIYKSIILRNLYGVDIMKEAVEIAKLRLFLKLVASVEADYRKPNLGLEPLPDIDFNIRAGNTLVGFGTQNELLKNIQVDQYGQYRTDYEVELESYKEKCDVVARAFTRYKKIQLTHGDNYQEFKEAKEQLNNRLKELNQELNLLLHKQYAAIPYDDWLQTHQPFHWFAEFYEIIHDRGGFDVVIGNPPYVEYSTSTFSYKVRDYETLACQDLYAFVIERSTKIINSDGAMGMIVPISIISTDGFASLRKVMSKSTDKIWYSSYSMRPAKLFDGVEKHLSIFIANRSGEKQHYSTKYHRWYAESRDFLFNLLSYVHLSTNQFHNDSIPKVGTIYETNIIDKIKTNKTISSFILKSSKYKIYHTRKLRYFLQFLDTAPKIFEEDGKLRITSELKELCFESDDDRLIANAAYLSSLFFWYYISYSDCRNLNKREVVTFPLSIDKINDELKDMMKSYTTTLLYNLQQNSYFQEAFYKKYGRLKMQVFQPRLSKYIVDEIDNVLAKHYGFTDEELDFIINYDIKYRMGKELDNEGVS